MTPTEDPKVREALKWADQPLDRVIESDIQVARALHTLADAYRSALAKLDGMAVTMRAGPAARIAELEAKLASLQEDKHRNCVHRHELAEAEMELSYLEPIVGMALIRQRCFCAEVFCQHSVELGRLLDQYRARIQKAREVKP